MSPVPFGAKTVVFAVALAAAATGVSWAQGGRSLQALDVCKVVPGESIAVAVGGKLGEARPFISAESELTRCTYLVDVPAPEKVARKAFVIWLYPPADFVELRGTTEGRITDIRGLGDEAYGFQDPGDGRSKVRVLRRGDVTIEATADTQDAARKIAGVALASLARAK
jgi:hypothetical protein